MADEAAKEDLASDRSSGLKVKRRRKQEKKIMIRFILVESPDESAQSFEISLDNDIHDVATTYCRQVGVALEKFAFYFDGARFSLCNTPRKPEMEKGDTISLIRRQVGC